MPSAPKISSRFFRWAALVRLPNTPTAIADVLAGYTLPSGAWLPPLPFALSIVAVVALYWAGMVWNDIADVKQDLAERPHRPIPSGSVAIQAAKICGLTLFAIGIAVSIAIDQIIRLNAENSRWNFGVTLTSAILIAFILLYDVVAKKTWAGPWLMGSCRACSLLLGCAAGGLAIESFETHVPRVAIIVAAIGHGVYVAGFTLAGRKEAAKSSHIDLKLGWLTALVGIVMLGSVDFIANQFGIDPSHRRIDNVAVYPLLILVLAIPLLRRAAKTLRTMEGRDIQASIKQAIFSIIFFDAAIALQFGSGLQAIIICSLIFPALFLGKWLHST